MALPSQKVAFVNLAANLKVVSVCSLSREHKPSNGVRGITQDLYIPTMSSKQPKEDTGHPFQLTPRCLVLVLKTRRDRRSGANSQRPQSCAAARDQSPGWGSPASPGLGGPQAANAGPGEDHASDCSTGGGGGIAIFESFQKENSGCYWNPHLEESIKGLKYVGLIQPNCLLVCGRDIYLDTVRNAFARKVLVPPAGFSVHKVGDLGPTDMCLVPQTQFTPLPEALCVVIYELNCRKRSATLDTVQEQLATRYRGMQAPPEEIVYETLGSLMKERKIYHTGSAGTGYFIVTPDTYKNGCFNQAHLGGAGAPAGPTLYVPLLTPVSAEMRSISCQTEAGEAPKEEEKKKSRLERSQSLNRGKSNKDKKGETLNRAMSLRYGEEKGKKVVKDINLRTSEAHQDKDKGEKTSLFNKIFGRGKSRRSVAVEEDVEEEPEVEYATFCAQFPPPEWAWYETQGLHSAAAAKGAVTSQMGAAPPPGVQTHTARVPTWPHLQGVAHFDAGTQSDFDDEDYLKPFTQYNHVTKHVTSTPHVTPHLAQHGLSLHSHESHSSSYDVTPSPHVSRRQERERSRHHRTLSKPRHHHGTRHSPLTPNDTPQVPVVQNEYVRHGDEDDDRHIYCEPSNPLGVFTHNSQYEDALLSQGVHDCLVASPTADHLHGNSLPTKNVNSNTLNNNNNTNGLKAELFPQLNSKSLPTRNNRSSQRRYRDLTCSGFCGTDISIEYKGRMPKRNSTFSLSRDSGVNCVGLKDSCTAKDPKKLALLNNQTGVGASSPSSRAAMTGFSNGGLNLNNHNRVSRVDSLLSTQALLHPGAGNTSGDYNLISHSHQDSGFSSPRTDADHANYSSVEQQPQHHHQHPSLPLNNISIDVSSRRSAGYTNGARPVSRSLSRDGGRHGRDSHRASLAGLHGIHAGAVGGGAQHEESGKENRACHPAFKSLESLHITSSEKYPSCGQLLAEDSRDSATVSSSRSGSSKTTVVGVGDSWVGGSGPGGGSANTSRAGDATYMEIQLVTADCPVHGDITTAHEVALAAVTSRDAQLVHRAKDAEAGVSKRHSMAGKSSRYYSGQWAQSRHSGNHGHHYGNGNLCGNSNNNTDKDGKSASNTANTSRLAFLGNCEVVGIL